ncbi:MAG: DUF1801 domain-containing protein [Pseudomonadales bacterium]
MAERKTQQTGVSPQAFLETVKNERRRKDSQVVLELMRAASGQKPTMWGPSIVGFGKREYTYANGKPAEICRIGFAPRAQSLVFYLGGFDERSGLLQRLGKHKVGPGGCLYVNKLDDVDLEVLAELFEKAYAR